MGDALMQIELVTAVLTLGLMQHKVSLIFLIRISKSGLVFCFTPARSLERAMLPPVQHTGHS